MLKKYIFPLSFTDKRNIHNSCQSTEFKKNNTSELNTFTIGHYRVEFLNRHFIGWCLSTTSCSCLYYFFRAPYWIRTNNHRLNKTLLWNQLELMVQNIDFFWILAYSAGRSIKINKNVHVLVKQGELNPPIWTTYFKPSIPIDLRL